MVTIVDYGLGNLGSVKKAVSYMGFECNISMNPDVILRAKKLILPGVGNFKVGMQKLEQKGLVQVLNELVLGKNLPILGICLGMQLMTSYSEEGNVNGLNWIPAKTKRFRHTSVHKVPHMGWNILNSQSGNVLLNQISCEDYFYFLHSFYVCEVETEYILAETEYIDTFVSVVNKNNIYGCQFHPEKSHQPGLRILKNFLEYC